MAGVQGRQTSLALPSSGRDARASWHSCYLRHTSGYFAFLSHDISRGGLFNCESHAGQERLPSAALFLPMYFSLRCSYCEILAGEPATGYWWPTLSLRSNPLRSDLVHQVCLAPITGARGHSSLAAQHPLGGSKSIAGEPATGYWCSATELHTSLCSDEWRDSNPRPPD